MARLSVETPTASFVQPLASRNTIGRHPDNSVQVLDDRVSRRHCVVEVRRNDFVLVPGTGTNRTYLNGVALSTERALRDGDRIVLGDTTLTFLATDPDPALDVVDRAPLIPEAPAQRQKARRLQVQFLYDAGMAQWFPDERELSDPAALRLGYARLRAFYALARTLAAQPAAPLAIEQTNAIARELFPGEVRTGIALRSPDGKLSAVEPLVPGLQGSLPPGLLAEAAKTRGPVLCADVAMEPRFAQERQADAAFAGILVSPILHGAPQPSFLVIAAEKKDRLGALDLELANCVAGLLGLCFTAKQPAHATVTNPPANAPRPSKAPPSGRRGARTTMVMGSGAAKSDGARDSRLPTHAPLVGDRLADRYDLAEVLACRGHRVLYRALADLGPKLPQRQLLIALTLSADPAELRAAYDDAVTERSARPATELFSVVDITSDKSTGGLVVARTLDDAALPAFVSRFRDA